jgi:ubiquinone/menaquinone biosynthesis C-methylase UbiE
MNKGKITSWIRQLGLLHGIDMLNYYVNKLTNRSKNKRFLQKYPNVALPPDYLIFESFKLDYEKYFIGGKESAVWLKDEISAFTDVKSLKILDWGCGPARILRHLPAVFGENCSFFGVDYNQKSIEWCQKNLKGISFSKNNLNPPLSFDNASFDFIYGISIFTHLSKKNHDDWFDELNRVLKIGGIMLLTTQGEAYKAIMTDEEKLEFDKPQLVIRDNVVEGHRVFSAFQPPEFIKTLFETQCEVLLHQAGQRESWGINQDLWILRKI